jgi:hypothetical protein
MATHSGRLGAVYVGALPVAEIKDWSIEETSEVTASTVMGSEWVTNTPTQKSWTASFNAFWSVSDDGQNALPVGAEVVLNLYPEGNTTSKVYWSGTAIINTKSKSASFDGLVEASFSATGDGALTELTVGA